MHSDNPPTASVAVIVIFPGIDDDPMANRKNLIVDSFDNPGLGKQEEEKMVTVRLSQIIFPSVPIYSSGILIIFD